VVYSRYDNGTDDGGATITYQEAAGKELPDYGIRIRRSFANPHGIR
jgi:hypothetical protein